ncbi:MAG: ABC transporter substrate-binding protein, partial [Deltaproteobacteria bacterium]|nr:ABC transporter substrate-binding protein [Deltaproteobacteria bacterium]
MKKLAVWLSSALALLGGGTLAAAGTDAAVKVGVVLPLTGTHAKFGEIEKNSFLMALEEINAGGGVRGRPIELIIEDDKSKPEVGRSAADKLISKDKVVALTGGYSSSVTFAMASMAQSRKVPFLVTSGSADEITEQGWEYVFRLNQPVSEYSKALVEFLHEVVNPHSVAILYENSMFGQSGSREFTDVALDMGWKIVVSQAYEAGAEDFKALLTRTKAANPDVVYMISYVKDAAILMRQAKELDFNPKLFAGAAAGFTLPEFAKLAGSAAENVFSATLWTPSVPYPGAKEYYDR